MPTTPVSSNPLRSRRMTGFSVNQRDINIVGASPKMQRIFKLVSKIARTSSTVLLVGESGTGKELIAQSIHLQSRRSNGPFVPVNVGALPEALIEAELFGSVRGAFTGATSDRIGLIALADGGTLFLDEIGDMPLVTQVKLLRTLENNEVRRLGENVTRLVDVRVVAATHRDLAAEVATGRFRQDLYYRLNVVLIELPPLRQRLEDVGLLASYFLERNASREGRTGLQFTPEAEALLERYDYPGNVRELENAIEHAVAVSEGTKITAADLPATIRAQRLLPRSDLGETDDTRSAGAALSTDGEQARVVPEPAARAASSEPATADHARAPAGERETWSLAEVEREHIRRVLARHRGNATTAARQLGISRTTLWRKLRHYGIQRKGG